MEFFRGKFYKGLKEDFGYQRYYNNQRFFGKFQKNLKHGVGVYIYFDGTAKVGVWKNDYYVYDNTI